MVSGALSPPSLPNPTRRFLPIRSGSPCDSTFPLGRRILRLWLLVTRCRHPPFRVFLPTTIITLWVPDSLSLPRYYLISFICSSLFSSLCSSLSPFPLSSPTSPYPFPSPRPRAFSRSRPCVRRRFLHPLPLARLYPRYDMVVQAAGLAPGVGSYLQVRPPLSVNIMSRRE